MNLIFFENRALSIHDGEMLLFCALDAYTTVYEHQVLLSTSASFENKTQQNRAKKKNDGENINFLYTVSSIILAERQKSMDFLFYLFTGINSMFIV